jgi:hypothetical protein
MSYDYVIVGAGLRGLGYDDLLPYFIRAEDQQHGASE